MKDDERVQSDGTTVWVHDATDGSCIGRFGRMGIDIHRPVTRQADLGECLLCTHGPTGPEEWRRFVVGMQEFYGVAVSERHRPRHITPNIQEKTMQKMTTYIVSGEHRVVPGRPMSAHFTPASADVAAFDLVRSLAADIRSAPEIPADATDWRKYLEAVQHAILDEQGEKWTGDETDDELADMTGCYVDITRLESDAPRMIVSLDGGLVQGVVSDIALDAFVIDYDVEGAAMSDLIDIPQTSGDTSEATMRGETADVDPAWIDAAIGAYETHDAEAVDEGAANEDAVERS